MSEVPFIKASACGNDFLLVKSADIPKDMDVGQLTRLLCDRHNGVGADGVEYLSHGAPGYGAQTADLRARLINADGSPAEISGNGTRCVAAYEVSQRGTSKVAIRTDAGVKVCALVSRDGNRFEFETAMGGPSVGEELGIKLAFSDVRGIPVSMGNPHYVVFVEKFRIGWQAEGAEISTHHDFKAGTNVEFVQVRDCSNIEVRFFERGAGETKSSGTGSCASAVASIFAGRAKSPVMVHAEGGTQVVRWENEVFLRGSAQLICTGRFFV
jgi:diaminopimelate epimerase